jgi:hypothetical protein
MSIATTLTAIQTMHAGISGVTSAPLALPVTIDARRLPLVFVWPGPTSVDGWQAMAGWYKHVRTYIVRCYVAEVSEVDEQVDTGYQAALPLLQRFGEAYMTPANQNLTGAVAHLGPPITDSGIGVLEYGATFYHGFEYRLTVTEKVVT